jgi:hypothetical protein
LFDLIDPTKVNKHLQELMPGLTIKVFRTYNASITLSRLLKDTDEDLEVPGKKAQVRSYSSGLAAAALMRQFTQYDEANKEVAILCNHQKGVSKNHDATMAKLLEKKEAMKAELKEASGAAVARIKCGACMPLACLRSALIHSAPQGALGDSGPQHGVPRVAQERVARHQQDQLS